MELSISDIKYKASEILLNNRKQMTKIFLVTGIIGVIISFVTGYLGFFGSIASGVLTLILGHAYVVSSLKAVNGQTDMLSIEEDSFVGFKRFKQLFFTYFINYFFLVIIMTVIILITIVAIVIVLPNFFDQIQLIIDEFNVYGTLVNSNAINALIEIMNPILAIVFICSVVLAIVVTVYTLTFALTPYILQKYDIRGVVAMKESARLMRGNKKTLFLLYLSFIGWVLLCAFIMFMVSNYIPAPITGAIEIIIATYIYNVNLKTCLAIFYEEIDLNDKVIVE